MEFSANTPWRARITEAATDREHGAGQITAHAAKALDDAAHAGVPERPIMDALRELVRGQRAMAPVLRMASDLAEAMRRGGAEAFHEAAHRWVEELDSAGKRFREALVASPPPKGVWAFHSFSSSVLSGAAALAEEGLLGEAVVGESRPGGEGRQTARRLADLGWHVRFVPDARLADLILQRRVERLVIGCDAWDESVMINKSGAGALAAVAALVGVEVEIWTTTHKCLPEGGTGQLDLEDAQGMDLSVIRTDLHVEQPLYGITRLEDVTRFRCERGALTSAEARGLSTDLSPLHPEFLEDTDPPGESVS